MKQKSNFLIWVFYIILVFIWGSSFILIKNGLKGFSIWQSATIRLVSAFLVLGFMAIGHIRKIPSIFLVGLFNMFVPAYLFCAAQSNISSGVAGILNSLTPMFTSVIAIVFFGKKINKLQWLGLAIGFCSTAFFRVKIRNPSSTKKALPSL